MSAEHYQPVPVPFGGGFTHLSYLGKFHVTPKNLLLLLATDGIYSHILNAIVTEYGISQLGDLGYYTFEVNGDEVLLPTQNRLDVEAAIGCPLLQLTGIGSCRQLSCLLAPSTVVEHIRAAVEEFESTHASA